ncbi:hypothetical protein Milano_044 [Agrobacterium phage Milano]|nr:hypothetical protein Milano_044 [Agrobacterium phage Milano]
MTRILSLQIQVSDDEFSNFIAKLASSVVGVSAHDEDGEELSTTPVGNVDKNGIPWLEAVHASTRTQTKDGRWKRLKGVTEEQRDAAEIAWKQANAAAPAAAPAVAAGPAAVQAVFVPTTATPPAPPAVNPAPTSVTIPPQVPAPAPAATIPVNIPGMTPPAPAPVPVVEDVPVTLDDVGNAFGVLQAKFGELQQTFIDQIYTAAGVGNPNEIVNDETKRKKVVEVINETIKQNS